MSEEKAALRPDIFFIEFWKTKDSFAVMDVAGYNYGIKRYQGNVADTYYGEALVIVRPLTEGTMTLNVSSPYGDAPCQIRITD